VSSHAAVMFGLLPQLRLAGGPRHNGLMLINLSGYTQSRKPIWTC
jgi:hypothetical protein